MYAKTHNVDMLALGQETTVKKVVAALHCDKTFVSTGRIGKVEVILVLGKTGGTYRAVWLAAGEDVELAI